MQERLNADQRLRTLLGNMLVQSRESMAETRLAFSGGQEENFYEPRRPAYLALLALPDLEGPTRRLSPYCEYVRRCNQLENQFSPEVSRADYDHFHRWYLDEYGTSCRPLRLAFERRRHSVSQRNDCGIGGHKFTVTRAMLWYMFDGNYSNIRSALDEESKLSRIIILVACRNVPIAEYRRLPCYKSSNRIYERYFQ